MIFLRSLSLVLESFGVQRVKDVVWTDKASIQIEAHRRFCCRKTGTQPRPKPR